MKVIRNNISSNLLAFILAFSVQLAVFADTPACNVCDIYEQGSSAYDACYELNCAGVDVPVSGNIWVLMVAGAVLMIVSKGYFKKKEEEV